MGFKKAVRLGGGGRGGETISLKGTYSTLRQALEGSTRHQKEHFFSHAQGEAGEWGGGGETGIAGIRGEGTKKREHTRTYPLFL